MNRAGGSMDKRNRVAVLVLAAFVLLAAAVSLLLARSLPPSPAEEIGDVVIISVNGEEYARVPLSSPRTVTVKQENGAENVIRVTEQGAVMERSTCHNQLCVHMGEVNRDNWEYRPNGAFIICLPNRVSVELVVAQ